MQRNNVRAILGIVTLVLVAIRLLIYFSVNHTEDAGIKQIHDGNVLLKAGDPASLNRSIELFRSAVSTFHGMHKTEENHNEGLAQFKIGLAQAKLKQYGPAIESVQAALPLLTGDDSKSDRANAYYLLGVYNIKIEKPDIALPLYLQAEPLYRELGKTEELRDTFSDEGAIYYNRGVAAAHKKDWAAARDAYMKSQSDYHQAQRTSDEADATHQLGLIYSELGDTAHASEARDQEKALRASAPPTGGK